MRKTARICLLGLMLSGVVAFAVETTGPRTQENPLAAADGAPQAAVVADEAPNENEAQEPSAAPTSDPFQQRLDAALAEYNPAIEMAIRELAKTVEEEFNKATKKGDIGLARKCKEAEQALRERGAPPAGDFLRTARENTQRKLIRAGAKLAAEFEAVAKECLRNGDLDRAESILSEKAELLAEMKSWRSGPSGVGGRVPRAAQSPSAVTSGQEKQRRNNAKEARLTLRHQQEEPGLCSVTCASIILDYFGTQALPRALKVMSRGRDYNPNEPFNDFTGTMFRDVCNAVSRLGLTWTQQHFPNDQNGFEAGLRQIRQSIDAGNPVLIDLTDAFGQVGSHVFVVCGYSDRNGAVYILDCHAPPPGLQEMEYEALAKVWNSLGVKDRPFNGRGLVMTSPKQPASVETKSTKLSP